MVGNEINLSVLIDVINAVGVVGLLCFMVLAFYKGEVIAKSVLDRILEVYQLQFEQMTEQIIEKLDSVISTIQQ